MNGLPNDMAKNGLLVIRDFYEDSKCWRKLQIWEEYMKGLNKILNEMTNKATLTITEFSKKANFCQKWWIWQRLIKCLAKTHKWVDKKKACEKLGISWGWTSSGPWSNGSQMTEKYLTMDVTLLSRKNKVFLLSLTKIYPLTEILPSMHREGIN